MLLYCSCYVFAKFPRDSAISRPQEGRRRWAQMKEELAAAAMAAKADDLFVVLDQEGS